MKALLLERRYEIICLMLCVVFYVSVTGSLHLCPSTVYLVSRAMFDSAERQCDIKKSVIGKHCRIGRGVRIHNTIVMDHVELEDDAAVSACIICSEARVESKVSATA